MKTCFIKPFLAAAALFPALLFADAPLFFEDFNSGETEAPNSPLSAIGWSAYLTTEGKTIESAGGGYRVYVETNGYSSDSSEYRNIRVGNQTANLKATNYLVAAQASGGKLHPITLDDYSSLSVRWEQGSRLENLSAFLAIEVDGKWYASQRSFRIDDERLGYRKWQEMGPIDLMNEGWTRINLEVGNVLSLDSSLTYADLKAIGGSTLTGIGWYMEDFSGPPAIAFAKLEIVGEKNTQ